MLILALITSILFSYCTNSTYVNNKCEINNIKSAECISDYYLDDDKSHLDSAMYYIDEVIGDCDDKIGLLTMRKLGIMSLNHEYAQAIEYIDSFDNELFTDMPYYQNLLKNRFKAMKYQSENDTIMKNNSLNICVQYLNKFLDKNRAQADSLMLSKNIELILENPLSITIAQYYYYRVQLEGYDKVKKELDKKVKNHSINEELYNYILLYLKEDFMIFIGI